MLTCPNGLDGFYVGVPTVIGAGRRKRRVVEISMNKDEQTMFDKPLSAPLRSWSSACKGIDESLKLM